MNPVRRQSIQGHRRLAAAFRDGRATGVRDEPVRVIEVPRRGLARIAGNEGDGEYTIHELWWDPAVAEWVLATAPLGLRDAEARDYMGHSAGGAGQVVPFWEHRGLGGEVRLFIDVNGGWDGAMKLSAFTAHYSGTDTTAGFHTVPNCRYGVLEACIDVRKCSGHGSASDHPGYTLMDETGALLDYAWGNTLATWSGRDTWWDLEYTAYAADGTWLGSNIDAIDGFYVQCRAADGDLEFRIARGSASIVSAVVAGVIRLTHFPAPPGTVEIGNCCCHEDSPGTWGDGEWGG
ncbi:MAG TPA: hypothetical protein VM695_06195 [Phycisphaerae bacterium]|nr:hypothetical protein [Phycisphaerae bacterium]